MPFQSESQRRYIYAKHPKIAEEFQEHTPEGKKLPEHVKKMAEGGIVESPSWKDQLKDYMKKNFGQPHHEMGSNLEGFQKAMKHKQETQDDMSEIDRLEKGLPASTQPPMGYAYGGMVGEEEKMGLPPVQPQVPPIQFNPASGMPPQTPQMPVQAPNPINRYLDTQKTQLNKFGPEEQLALSQNLVKQRQSLPAKGAVALGGLADTLSRVGGGNSNFMGSIQDQQNRLAGEQTSALEKAGTQNIARTEANQKLDAMDPRSELSKVAQQTWGPLLAQNGFKPDQIANMPASSIAALTGQSVEALKAKAEAEMARATLGLKTNEAAESARHNVAAENVATENLANKTAEDKRQALQETAKHWLLHPRNAMEASKRLGQEALSSSPEHDEALAWAEANPTDPRAARILKLHGR